LITVYAKKSAMDLMGIASAVLSDRVALLFWGQKLELKKTVKFTVGPDS